MKKKDPAFLFYSKDWLEGTAEMTPEEKGVYIDLLSHQHQKGSIPSDPKRIARMVGLPEIDFLRIWDGLKTKFVDHPGDRMVNRKLTEIITERSTKGSTNRLTSRFAVLLRGVSPQIREILKSEFKVAHFLPFPTEEGTERLTEWFNSRLPFLEDANNIYSIVDHKGVKNNFPKVEDFNGLPEIKIGSAKQLIQITQKINVSEADIMGMWEVFKVQALTGKKFYPNEDEVYSHFINWVKDKKFTQTTAGVKLKFD